MRPIAIRLFENRVFGTTYGPGLRRSAVFNATAEVSEPYAKYLLDFESGPAWINHSSSEAQLKIARNFVEEVDQRGEDVLWSWVKWYDKGSGHKELVEGFAWYDLGSEEIVLHLNDAARGVTEQWILPARRCQAVAGRNSPAFLATNHDLTARDAAHPV
jgi:hypothetical protein